jgi:S-adenosylmethionine hydrolase
MARPAAPRTVVTLTTDFGAGSPYVAAMKGVLLGAAPEATLVDISHAVPAFDLRAASFLLWAGTRHFGPGAVHLVVVDPGVGTVRRPVAFELGGSLYVGPDNGVFTRLLEESGPAVPTVVELRRAEGASPTFEGRDVFAPAAGALASGMRLRDLGDPAEGLVRLPDRGPSVLWVDSFGNLITSLKPPVAGVRIGSAAVTRSARTFGDAPRGALFFYIGSMGLVEVAVREGRADALLGAGPGTAVSPL